MELLRECTKELKSRALDIPFLLLPFRPSSDPSAARTFVRNYFLPQTDREALRGTALANEVKMTDVMILASVMKWCWSRLPGGVVTWEAYEMFRVGEKDSHYARDAFTTFLPISVESDARVKIIEHFFDLLAAVAAHGKTNGLGGRKLSRYAGWWAFEHYDTGKGFEAGYKSWANAADATSHLFFAYLRSLSPESVRGANGILGLPRSLQQLVESTEYPPEDSLMSNETTKVVMIVDVVSPTPYALLRRAKNFEYRDDDSALQQFASYDDPVQVLTDECRRVLKSISSINQSNVSTTKESTSLLDPSWSRFEDMGFGATIEENDDEDSQLSHVRIKAKSLNATARSHQADFGNRPTTPSWADFLSAGFVDENGHSSQAPVLLPPDRMLPPIKTMPRGQSSQSHRRNLDVNQKLEPGELASINKVLIDDAFWWVWISSLAGEEPTSRKAVFGRCALIETTIPEGKWMVMEEQVKGAAPEPATGAYIAEKKSFLGFTTKRGRLTRRRSAIKKSALSPTPYSNGDFDSPRATLAPEQQARAQQAAAELVRKKQEQEQTAYAARRGRITEDSQSKTNSVFTLGPMIKHEASPAMQWATQYDKDAIRAQYLGDAFAGKGSGDLLTLPPNGLGNNNASVSSLSSAGRGQDLPTPPPKENRAPSPLPRPAPVQRAPSPPTTVTEPAVLPITPAAPVQSEPVDKADKIPLPEATPAFEEPRRTEAPVKTNGVKPPTPRSVDVPPRSSSGSQEQKRLKKEKKEPTPGPPQTKKTQGIRRLFGTQRSRSKEPPAEERTPNSPVETNPAILAARRALEGHRDANETSSPPLSPSHFNKLRNAKSPIAAIQTVPAQGQRLAGLVRPADRQPSPAPAPAPAPTPATAPVHESLDEADEEEHHGVPRTRRDEEYDKLSRVDTNEREHADREFSTFDQGPLLEQPAFVPSVSKERLDSFATPAEEMPRHPHHQSTYSQVTMNTATDEENEHDEPVQLTQQISPTDRWAQIRKNAAERAQKQSEEQGRRSHTDTRTDDGETSGEETIESRVARIKARVAELTGNMESARK